ncbi:MAG: RQC domain-containing protein, partial [Verrucomicrobiota bacterium]
YNYADVRTQEFFIEGSNPTPQQVQQVWTAVRTHCHAGPVKASIEDWSSWIDGMKNDMAVRTVFGVLERSGLIERHMEPGERIYTTGISAGADFSQLEEQFIHMDKKRKTDELKLKNVINYANVNRCRHAFILNYFGETDISDQCDHCDQCVRPGSAEGAREPTEEEWVILQKVLSCVARMKGRFGVARVAQVLLGSKAKQIVEWRLDQLSTYGIMAGHKEAYIRAILEALIQDGSVEISGDEYPLVNITQRGVNVLKKEDSIVLIWPESTTKATCRKKSEPADDLSESMFDPALYSRLREWRNDTARTQGIPAYLVLHDRTLKAIAIVQPQSHADFESIVGIGPAKTKKFGDAVLDIVDQWKSG